MGKEEFLNVLTDHGYNATITRGAVLVTVGSSDETSNLMTSLYELATSSGYDGSFGWTKKKEVDT